MRIHFFNRRPDESVDSHTVGMGGSPDCDTVRGGVGVVEAVLTVMEGLLKLGPGLGTTMGC